MLGINVADAVLVGTLLISLVAMVRGMQSGEAAKKTGPPDPPLAVLGATLVDTETFRGLVEALQELTEQIRRGIDHQKSEATSRIEELLAEIAHKVEPPAPRRRPARRRRE